MHNRSFYKFICVVLLAGMMTCSAYAQTLTPTIDSDGTSTVLGFKPVEIDNRDHSGSIPDGVWYGPLDLSDMTYDEAKRSITVYVMSLQNAPIALCARDGQRVTVPAKDLGLQWDDEDTLYEALILGNGGNVVSRFKERKDLERENKIYDLKVSFDRNILSQTLHSVAEKYNIEPTESTMERVDDEFVITEGKTGYMIDENASAREIENTLSNWNGENVSIDLVASVKEPKGTKEELSKVKDLLGSFHTSLGSSNSDRSRNVRNGMSLINGTILYPGEEFSTYEKVSPFTEENGYYLAGSYLNGSVVETFGGGICQVSTTLYNAVLLSELEVTERHNHSMLVNYVDISGDAAISGTTKDFKFVNNTKAPIYIESDASDSRKVVFNIYGQETRPANRTVELMSIETGRLAPEENIVEDPTKPVGYRAVRGGHVGYSGEYWRIIKVDGVETEREKINVSNYQSTPTTIVVGTGPAELAALLAEPAAAPEEAAE
ncbi:MAG: VanW family protein [Lachnospiraceae bacterium]|nr:VanW family protein [Lachnospiraceae bacterium]